ncbi:MAG: hypothetical protein Q8O55_08040 [Dehalococcoidales bacterium]|nr:hypothetical protein [Dehalococcoidales bacterium]
MANLLLNPGFETGDPPDNWSGVNVTPLRGTDAYSGTYSLRMTAIADSPYKRVRQSISNPSSYSGKVLTLSVRTKVPAGGANLRISIEDNVDRTEAIYPGGTDYTLLTVTRTITAVCTVLYANVLWVNSYIAIDAFADDAYLDIQAAPTVTTQAVTAISGTTATGNGNITDLGYPDPTQHGHCWNTAGTPTTADSKTENGAASATGAFVSAMPGLTPGSKYYVRAYATNSAGTSYGDEVTIDMLPRHHAVGAYKRQP